MTDKKNTEKNENKKRWVEPIWIGKDEDKNSPTRHSETKPFTDNFFENVVVNDENENMKKNRLELLEMFCNTFDNFIDFSKIEGA